MTERVSTFIYRLRAARSNAGGGIGSALLTLVVFVLIVTLAIAALIVFIPIALLGLIYLLLRRLFAAIAGLFAEATAPNGIADGRRNVRVITREDSTTPSDR